MGSRSFVLPLATTIVVLSLFMAGCSRSPSTTDVAESDSSEQAPSSKAAEADPAPAVNDDAGVADSATLAEPSPPSESDGTAEPVAPEDGGEADGGSETDETGAIDIVPSYTASDSGEAAAAGDDSMTESAAEAGEDAGSAESNLEVPASAVSPEDAAGASVVVTTGPVDADSTKDYIVHIVQPGENLFRIGLRYGYSWVVLAPLNGIPNPDYIVAGQAVRIPAPAGPTLPGRIRSGMADMLLVPKATFAMGGETDVLLAECGQYRSGCEPAWFEAATPVHMVTVDSFYLDETEVTNEAYVAFLNDLGDHQGTCAEADCLTLDDSVIQLADGRYDSDQSLALHPVTGVTWFGAQAFCGWRGARLPTEAEWERAAGWDDVRQERRLYPWGDTFSAANANTCDTNCNEQQALDALDDGASTTAAVGSYPAGASLAGALDMSGNVWEWLADWFDPDFYAESPSSNPAGPETGDYKVVRGGSWYDTPNFTAAAIRFPAPPDESGDSIGFRCAMSVNR